MTTTGVPTWKTASEDWRTIPVLPFHEAAAHVYAELRADLEQRGEPLAEPDLRIAAIALAFDLVLVTGNERHIQRVPTLRIENWIQPA